MAFVPLDQAFSPTPDAAGGGNSFVPLDQAFSTPAAPPMPEPSGTPPGMPATTMPPNVQAPAPAATLTQTQPSSGQDQSLNQDLSLGQTVASDAGKVVGLVNAVEPGTIPNEVGGGLTAAGGALSLAQGITTGNPGQIATGTLSTLQGVNKLTGGALSDAATGALKNIGSSIVDALPDAAGKTLSNIGSTIGSIAGEASNFVPLVGAAIGGLTANLKTQAGNESAEMQAGLAGLAPIGASIAASVLGSSTIGATAAALGATTAAAGAAVYAAPAAFVIGVALAINQALNPPTNFAINKIAGQVGPSATAATGRVAQVANQMDFNTASPADLQSFAKSAGNALLGRYSSTGAGLGTNKSATAVSAYMDGLAKQDPAAFANANANLSDTTDGLLKAIGAMQKAGVDPKTIGGLFDDVLEPRNGLTNSIFTMNAGGMDPRLSALMPSGFGNPGVSSGYGNGSYGDNFNSPGFQASALGGSTWLLLSKLGLLQEPDRLKQFGVTVPPINQTYLDSYKGKSPVGQTMDQSQFWGSNCFTADTRVLMADGELRPIEKVKIGDHVRCFDWTYCVDTERPVTQNNKTEPGRLAASDRMLYTINGIRVTGMHRFATGFQQWKRAKELAIGDIVLGPSGECRTIKTLEIGPTLEPVFNLRVGTAERVANFYVNDPLDCAYLVHNGGGGGDGGGGGGK